MSVPVQPSQQMRNEAGPVLSSIKEQETAGRVGLGRSTKPNASQALDSAIFASLHELLGTSVLEQTFRELLEQTRMRIEQLVGEKDPRTIRETAHSIRGAAAMLGATSLADAAARLEDRLIASLPGVALAVRPELPSESIPAWLYASIPESRHEIESACLGLAAALRQERFAL